MFKEGKPPNKGQSNDYFMQAALVCNTEQNDRAVAINKIREIYDKWQQSDSYSGRPFSNILAKIDEVYDKDLTVTYGGDKSKKKEKLAEAMEQFMEDNRFYSDKKTRLIYTTDNGFLEEITVQLESRIVKDFGTDKTSTNEFIYQVWAKSPDLPQVEKDKIRFKNGVFDTSTNIFDSNDEITLCMIGYPEYDYKADANPISFISMIESQVKTHSLDDLKTWLSKVPTAKKEIRMAVCYGEPGTGKTALAEVLQHSLTSKYSKAVTMGDYFKDMVTRAGVIGKTLLYFQDAPKKWDQIDKLKQLTGENQLPVRELYKESEMSRNMLNIIISTNNLPKIADDDAGPMFDRLTLIEFEEKKIRGTNKDDEDWAENIAKLEGELIISYCLNLRKGNLKFSGSKETKYKWNIISCPELKAVTDTFTYDKNETGMSIHQVMEILNQRYPDNEFELKSVAEAIKEKGFTRKSETFIGLKVLEIPDGQETLD
jgi:phage/plasmid-associated DNA primase